MLLHLLSAFALAITPSATLCSIGPQPLITKELGAREERMWQMPSLQAGPWQNRRQPVVYFVAEPTPDTAYAGMYTDAAYPGTEQQRPRRIYGQVVRVQRIAGAGAEALERTLAGDPHRRAVVISHDLGAACEDIPRSGRWLPSSPRPGFFVASIRHPQRWAGGLPTFEVHPPSPYPCPYGGQFLDKYVRAYPRWDVPTLSADECFDLYAALPGWSEIAADPHAAFRPVWRWRARHPHLAEAFPARRMLREARATIQACEGTLSLDEARALGVRCPDWAR